MRTKQDKARISRQLHEIAYCRKLAREMLKEHRFEKSKRVAMAFLKFTNGYTKSPNGRKWKKL